jgi:hypothetical protein
MANYQLSHLPLSTRLDLAFQMLDTERPWGLVTDLAQKHDVSRKFLYELRDRAQDAVAEALLPKAAGRKSSRGQVEINDDFVKRAIAVCLSVVPGTIRAVQLLLKLLFDIQRSVGFISQTAKELGARVRNYLQELYLPIQALVEADEIFQGHKPCLTVVDGRSFLVLSLSVQSHRDETAWGSVLLDVQKQGVQIVDVASDGARGIQSGVKTVSLMIPLRPDLFHLIRGAHRVTQRLENKAYQAIEVAERARRADWEQAQPKRRRGRQLKVKVELPQAEIDEDQAIELVDYWQWLFHEMRLALEPIGPNGCLVSTQQARQTVQTALELLATLDHTAIKDFVAQITEKLDDLLAPIEWLEKALEPWREGLEPEMEAFIIWAWKHHKRLAVSVEQVLPSDQQDLVVAFWNAFSLFHRSSSLAESLHSWLRPYLQVHRGMPDWLLPLLHMVWNHHIFQRGERQGKSPMELAGIENAPQLSQLFDWLSRGTEPIPAPAEFFKVRESVTQFA